MFYTESPRCENGFTLVELIVCLALLTIFLFATTASYNTLVARHAGETQIKALARLFHSARSEAIRSAQIITICPLDENRVCSSDWNRTISIFTDPNNLKRLTARANLLQEVNVSEYGRIRSAPSTRRYFQFTEIGSARGTMGNLTWCAQNDTAETRQQLIITLSGRVRLARDMDGDGVREKADGSAISC
ncbi:GspH/FimT family pseudopilin [Marinobacter sp. HL-58]|uniref:GspH/FimT family pseudopilin n=1 Tax=Marinobacter sp. HL-58 TaxID=1479237 RepID=UPI00047FA207|nr:GspH/FimT family pseudopilin [Marinobacter sp. HL-58]KPQ01843.1 MAG: T4SS system assembly protein FimT [Marinobacter sp. HL-58]